MTTSRTTRQMPPEKPDQGYELRVDLSDHIDSAASRSRLAQDGPLTEQQEAEALHVALRGMSIGHPGYLHPTGQPFRYRPGVCPGCAYSVIREMFRERGVQGG